MDQQSNYLIVDTHMKCAQGQQAMKKTVSLPEDSSSLGLYPRPARPARAAQGTAGRDATRAVPEGFPALLLPGPGLQLHILTEFLSARGLG